MLRLVTHSYIRQTKMAATKLDSSHCYHYHAACIHNTSDYKQEGGKSQEQGLHR